jgi:hypothetical protein
MSYKVIFVGAQAHEDVPAVAVYAVDRRGRVGKKIAAVSNGELSLPEGRPAVVAFGPDVADPAALDPATLVTVRLADQLPVWERGGVQLPGGWWRGWIPLQICLTGTVNQCYPLVLRVEELRAKALGLRGIGPIERCVPICNAVVEVWESTVCCFPFLISDVPILISKLTAYLAANPVMFPPLPSPGPVERAVEARVTAALAAGNTSSLFVPSTTLAAHLQALQSMAPADAVSYVESYPSRWPLWCGSPSVAKLAETPVNPGGSFSYCYGYYPLFNFRCRNSYFYKVKQLIGGAWVYIYDGYAANQYFAADESAALVAQGGQTCFQPPSLPGNDYIAFQAIGQTNTYDLYSNWAPAVGGVDQMQAGDMAMIPLVTDAGLTVGDGAPWATQLPLLLNYDPALQYIENSPFYYRFSVVQAGANGAPLNGAAPVPLLTQIAWSYFDTTTDPVTIGSQLLGPFTVNGNEGLYQIPYFGEGNPDWLGNQFHQVLDTTGLKNNIPGGPPAGNGQFLLILEVFDAGGNRLVPGDSAAPLASDTVSGFTFVRLMDAATTANVPYNALTHVLWVDNRPLGGGIEYFMNSNGVQVCQFYQEDATTPFYVGFEAYHTVMCDQNSPIPSASFMAGFSLTWQEGLGGTSGTLASGGDTNWGSGCSVSIGNAVSTAIGPLTGPPFTVPVVTFGQMLGTDPVTLQPLTACSFAINLNASPKHTNGSGTIIGYGLSTDAAVALSDGSFCDVIKPVAAPSLA